MTRQQRVTAVLLFITPESAEATYRTDRILSTSAKASQRGSFRENVPEPTTGISEVDFRNKPVLVKSKNEG